MQTKFAKIAALTVGLTFALSLSVNTAGAVTVAELQAQINALMAQLSALNGGAGTGANTSYTFSQDLTIGSTGGDVVSLQQYLVGGNYLNMPTGVAYGYFGSLTKAAVMKWQAANGVSATGYFGPISRAKANSMSMGGTTGTVPGTTVGGTTGGGVITTPGVEGTLTATLASTPTSVKLYEGDTKKAVMGVQLEAKLSDIKVERIKVKLDATAGGSVDRDFYRKIASKIYVMDGSTVLASSDLNANTVVEESSGNFYVTLTGLNYVVSKDAKKTLTIALDAMSTWDSGFNTDTWTVTIPADGVRGVDGAGVNQYSSSVISRDFTSENESISGATLQVSLNGSSPVSATVIAANGTDKDEKDGVVLLKFDVKADKDAVTITDLATTITRGGSGAATSTTAYLMDGSTVIDSATANTLSATGGTVTFDSIDYVVPAGVTKTLTIAIDVRKANTTATTFVAAVTNGQITDENSAGDSVVDSGSATGETITVLSAGPEFTIKSATSSYTPAAGYTGATSTAKATFVINIKAVGADLYFGTQAASSTFVVGTYKGGVNSGADYVNGSTTSYIVPSSGVITNGLPATVAFKLTDGQNVDVTVETIFPGRLTTGVALGTDAYAFGIKAINWSTATNSVSSSTFMDGKTSWRTSTVVLP